MNRDPQQSSTFVRTIEREITPQAQIRVSQLERQRRQDLLTSVTITTLILVLSGLIPALRPTPEPIMLVWVIAAALCYVLTLVLNRADHVTTATAIFLFGLGIFYLGAIFLVPSGPHRELSYSYFSAGNMYYFVLGVIPTFAATLLLDLPWPYLINGAILFISQISIWALPHDAAFNAFAQTVGGTVFLAASVSLGQLVLFALALAIARTMRNALDSAYHVANLEALNARIADRQIALEADITRLQNAHAQLANGSYLRINIPPTSELYPLAISLNLMSDRLGKLNTTNYELAQLQRGVSEAAEVIRRMGQGDLATQTAPTGTMADGLIAAIIQVQGQISAWLEAVSLALHENGILHTQTGQVSTDLVMAIRQLEELTRLSPDPMLDDSREMMTLARQNAEYMHQLLQSASVRERQIAESLERIRFTHTSPSGAL